MKVRILECETSYQRQPFKTPLVLSTGAITDLIEATASVRVEVDGCVGTGHGSIYLSDLWAWPDPSLSHEQREHDLKAACESIRLRLIDLTGAQAAHPMELGLRLHDSVCHQESQIPILARAMCLSPFDAAIHDAAGQALDRSAFDFYEQNSPIPSAEKYFSGDSARHAVQRVLRAANPRRKLQACFIVSKNDVLDRDVRPWAMDRGYRSFKLKIMGKDNAIDVRQTVALYRAAREWGVENPFLTVDSNEGNPNAESVMDFLQRLRGEYEDAFNALGYLEQPTGRNILEYRHDWRAVSKLKPVMLDEGLTSMELLPEALAQGWTGLALKTCKGHSFALLAAAWAHAHGMLLSLQDLTNPGFSLIHGALLGANLPTINGVELNSPQFTPAANARWLPRLARLVEPTDGVHRLSKARPPGLGTAL